MMSTLVEGYSSEVNLPDKIKTEAGGIWL
jgi:hypothetical protein